MTDDDIKKLWHEVSNQEPRTGIGHQIAFARALLARYSHITAPTHKSSNQNQLKG